MTMKHSSPTAKTIEEQVKVPAALDEAAIEMDHHFCDVSGFGNLQWAEIEDSAGKIVRLEGPIDLLSLKGRLRHAGDVTASDYRVLLAKHTDNGISVVGGRLVDGVATLLELTISSLEQGESLSTTVVSTYHGKKAAEKLSKEQVWAKAMDLSSSLEKKGKGAQLWGGGQAALPIPGDVVKHRQFGDCVVVKLGDDHIALQKPDGRIVQLGLRILSFSPFEKDGNRTLWNVSVKR